MQYPDPVFNLRLYLVGGEFGLILGDGAGRFGLSHLVNRDNVLGNQLGSNTHLFRGSVTLDEYE